MPFRSAHELWTKLNEKYDVSKIMEDDCIPSTSGRDELSSTSPKCCKTQGNDMVSGDENCNGDSKLTCNDPSSLSHCNASSLDLNTYSTINALHACVDSPCISCVNCLNKSHDDMLALSCCHDIHASISSSCCVSNNVEETEDSMGQDKILNGASSNSSSSHVTHLCLMARGSKVTPTLEPNTSCDDEDEDNDEEEDDDTYEEEEDIIRREGEIIYNALPNDTKVRSLLVKIVSNAIESHKIIEERFRLEREYALEIASLENSLEEEEEVRATLEEKLESIEESHDEIIAKLNKEHDHALAKLSSSIANDNNACATNSTTCEASILKENVELRAQLELLTSKYGKLEENHEKLSSSHEDLLVTHARLKLAHEAISTKVTTCEPHVDISTSSQNAILPCASPSNSSNHIISKSCDELLSLPCSLIIKLLLPLVLVLSLTM